ncbi:unnamed protein product, partial [Cladocopium goreaui]
GDTDEDIGRVNSEDEVCIGFQRRHKRCICVAMSNEDHHGWKRMYLHGKHLPSGDEHEKLDDWLDFRQLPGLGINAMPSTSLQNVQFSLDVA